MKMCFKILTHSTKYIRIFLNTRSKNIKNNTFENKNFKLYSY